MRAGVTELRNTGKATPGERCSNYVRRTGEATPGERLRNSVQTTGNYSSSNEARRRAASAEGASRTPSGGRVITASLFYNIVIRKRLSRVVLCLVFGCADPPTSGNVWFKRLEGDAAEAEMGCRTTSEKWRVTCVDNQWTGILVNCSHCTLIHSISISSSCCCCCRCRCRCRCCCNKAAGPSS